jgi:hypothetical protein
MAAFFAVAAMLRWYKVAHRALYVNAWLRWPALAACCVGCVGETNWFVAALSIGCVSCVVDTWLRAAVFAVAAVFVISVASSFLSTVFISWRIISR